MAKIEVLSREVQVLWEQINNSEFNPIEFDGIKKQVRAHHKRNYSELQKQYPFVLSLSKDERTLAGDQNYSGRGM